MPATCLREAAETAGSQLASLSLGLVLKEFGFPDSVQVCFNLPKEELSLINSRRLEMVEETRFPAPGRALPTLRDRVRTDAGMLGCLPAPCLSLPWEPRELKAGDPEAGSRGCRALCFAPVRGAVGFRVPDPALPLEFPSPCLSRCGFWGMRAVRL